MKSKIILLFLSLLLLNQASQAQFGQSACMGGQTIRQNFSAAPAPVVTGTVNTQGSTIKYTNVLTGVGVTQQADCIITIDSVIIPTALAGSYGFNYDVPGTTIGFDTHFQPSFTPTGSPIIPAGTYRLSVVYTLRYYLAGTTTPLKVPISFEVVDNDGGTGNPTILESVSFITPASALQLASPTSEVFINGNTAQVATAVNQAGVGTASIYNVYASYRSASTVQIRSSHLLTYSAAVAGGNPARYSSFLIGCTYPAIPVFDYANNTISGNLFNDLTNDNTVNGTGTNLTSAMFANLTDSNGVVIATVAIAANGSYSFTGLDNGYYKVQVSSTQGTVGLPVPTATLPPGYVNTAETVGTAAGNDGNTNGNSNTITLIRAPGAGTPQITVPNVNFGIDRLPESAVNLQPAASNPGANISVAVPAGAFQTSNVGANPNTGDADGGAVVSIRITAFPSNATSITINGTTYTSATFPVGGVVVPYTNGVGPTQAISVDPVDGNVSVVIPFAATDNSGKEDPTPGSVTIPFQAVAISGTVFNDLNGNAATSGLPGAGENPINGTNAGAGILPGAPLYANLVNAAGTVIATVPVSATGTYSFPNAPANATGLVVQLSTNQGVVGSPKPATALPTGWVTTGENNNGQAGNTEATPNGEIPINTGIVAITNQNFGIEQPPTPGTSTIVALNPTLTNQYTIPPAQWSGTDPNGGTIASLTITMFPANVTTLVVNGTSYTSATFPVGGINVPTNATGQPTVPITVDPIDGTTTVNIPYTVTDNAGQVSPIAGNVQIQFLQPVGITGTLFNDVNASATGNNTSIPSPGEVGTNFGTPIYAYLVDPVTNLVLQVVPVNSNGVYSFGGITPNSNVTVMISTTSVAVGAAAPTPTLAGTNAVATSSLTTTFNVGAPIPPFIENINFGAQNPPRSFPNTLPSQPNPAGVSPYTIPPTSFVNTDTLGGEIVSIRITAFPTGANSITINGITYTSGTFPVGGVVIPTNASGDPLQTISVDPVDGAVDVVVPFTSTDNGGATSTPGSVTIPFLPVVALSGTVFNDNNGNAATTGTPQAGEDPINGTNAGAGVTAGAVLYANLIDAMGNVIATTPISSTGTYSFPNAPANANLTVQLSTTQGVVGSPKPATALPTSWVTTGENNNGQAGNTEATPNGEISIITTTVSITNQNFGIEKLPESAVSVQPNIGNPGGTNSSIVPASAFQTSNVGANPNTGDANGGTVTSIRITAFPSNATSITINGTTYTSATFPVGGVIVPYTNGVGPTQAISVDPIEGNVDVVIPFAAIDNGGKEDPTPGSVTIPFKTITLSGTVFNDVNVNATTNGTPEAGENPIDGTNAGAGAAGAVLYANLIDPNGNVIATAPIGTDGTYSFPNVPALSTGLTVQLTTIQGVVNSPKPATVLPPGWTNSGENNNGQTGPADVIANGEIPITTTSVNVTTQNFGIEKQPESAVSTTVVGLNPGGTNSVTVNPSGFVNSNVGTNPNTSDFDGGTVTSIRITAFPTNATSITINGTTYTSATWPPAGVTIPYTAGVGPSQAISIDPVDGLVSVVIPFVAIDNGGKEDATPGSVTLEFSSILPVKFISFNANTNAKDVELLWKVGVEINVAKYEIEHSVDGINFVKIAVENATGNNYYNYTHTNAKLGINYYRIKSIDIDNKTGYSVIRKVNIGLNITDMVIYPMPAVNTVNITMAKALINKAATINVLSIEGKLMYQQSSTSLHQTESLDLSKLASGSYILQIKTKDEVVNKQIKIVR